MIDDTIWTLNKVQRSAFDFECATLCEFALSSSWLAEDIFTVVAGNYGLSMTEDDSCLVASSAFNIHEIAVGRWHQPFQFMGLPFAFEGGVKEISVHLW